jgi:hypothetical protein
MEAVMREICLYGVLVGNLRQKDHLQTYLALDGDNTKINLQDV